VVAVSVYNPFDLTSLVHHFEISIETPEIWLLCMQFSFQRNTYQLHPRKILHGHPQEHQGCWEMVGVREVMVTGESLKTFI
jgi:hypothetical protein